jgi:hypothetical protein
VLVFATALAYTGAGAWNGLSWWAFVLCGWLMTALLGISLAVAAGSAEDEDEPQPLSQPQG